MYRRIFHEYVVVLLGARHHDYFPFNIFLKIYFLMLRLIEEFTNIKDIKKYDKALMTVWPITSLKL